MVDIAVIGAGAAGCLAAIKGAEAGAEVALLEKNSRIGRKIMLTGKGRCNITNTRPWGEFSAHLHSKPAFLKPAFFAFSNEDTVKFFNSIGVETVLTRDRRIFPADMKSSTVVDALAARIGSLPIDCRFGCDVAGITCADDGTYSVTYVQSGKMAMRTIAARCVIVATGGLSYPTTGSTGAGYEFARDLGHSIRRTFPSLTAITPENYDRRLEGITLLNVTASLFVGHDSVACEFGELQFTDGGIEGPVGFKLSRKAVWAKDNGDKVSVSVDLKPAVPLDEFRGRVAALAEQAGVSSANFASKAPVLLRKLMPAPLVAPFIDSNRLNLSNLAAAIKDWRFKIGGYVGYRRAVVTAGGVNLEEVNSRTMGSRLHPGLYFAGEVLDMDGDTGGYNLQIAFSTGALAAASAAEYANGFKKS